MQERDDAILSELGIAEWLEAYQHISASAVGKRGPIRPGPGKRSTTWFPDPILIGTTWRSRYGSSSKPSSSRNQRSRSWPAASRPLSRRSSPLPGRGDYGRAGAVTEGVLESPSAAASSRTSKSAAQTPERVQKRAHEFAEWIAYDGRRGRPVQKHKRTRDWRAGPFRSSPGRFGSETSR